MRYEHFTWSILTALVACSGSNERSTANSSKDSEASHIISQTTKEQANLAEVVDSSFTKQLFQLKDAEKILGEKAVMTESKVKDSNNVFTYNNGFLASMKDDKTGKTGAIYFMFEEHSTVESAKKVFLSLWTDNKKDGGAKQVQGLGDEALLINPTGGKISCTEIFRKGKRIIRLKVNKITSHTSLKQFFVFMEKLSGQI
jgi:hypothetical protein